MNMAGKADIESVDKAKITYKNKLKFLLKYLIMFIILAVLGIISLVKISRIGVFAKIFGSMISNFEGIGLILFMVTMLVSILYHLIILAIIFFKYIQDLPWYEKLYKFDKKIDLINYIFKVFAILFFIMIYVMTPCTISGPSMEPTFKNGNIVVCSNPDIVSPKKNDIIVFEVTNDLVYGEEGKFYIKRIVATPNSRIKCEVDGENYVFYVDDFTKPVENLKQHEYDSICSSIGINPETTSFIVPKDKYLVFGDNRKNSTDSRVFGFIDKKIIFGKVIFSIVPFGVY